MTDHEVNRLHKEVLVLTGTKEGDQLSVTMTHLSYLFLPLLLWYDGTTPGPIDSFILLPICALFLLLWLGLGLYSFWMLYTKDSSVRFDELEFLCRPRTDAETLIYWLATVAWGVTLLFTGLYGMFVMFLVIQALQPICGTIAHSWLHERRAHKAEIQRKEHFAKHNPDKEAVS